MEEKLQNHKSLVCSFLDCKATFSKSWRLEAHLCKHTGLKPFTCSQCDKSFSARYRLSRHQRNHSGEKPHECLADGCSKGFGTYTSMKNHMARVHQHKDRLYRCKGCGNDFSKRNQLKAHLGEHLILAFPCTVSGCTRQFLSLRKLKHHEKVHEGYPCENVACTFQGKTWTEYLKHRKEHKVKEVHSGECNKVFNNAWFKQQHEERVHCEHKWMLMCHRNGCGKTFTRGFNLDSHVLGEHEGKKPFSCSHAGCGKSFAMKESLWRHGVVHDPAKRKLKRLLPKKNQPWHVSKRLKKGLLHYQIFTAKLPKTNVFGRLKDKP